jgi:hypothetical protein
MQVECVKFSQKIKYDNMLSDNIMLDAVSLMPKRSINTTGAKVYKSDTTC